MLVITSGTICKYFFTPFLTTSYDFLIISLKKTTAIWAVVVLTLLWKRWCWDYLLLLSWKFFHIRDLSVISSACQTPWSVITWYKKGGRKPAPVDSFSSPLFSLSCPADIRDPPSSPPIHWPFINCMRETDRQHCRNGHLLHRWKD